MDFAKYEVEVTCPKCPSKPVLNVSLKDVTAKDYEEMAKKMKVYEKEMEKYEVLQKVYQAQKNELMETFIYDLFVENGVEDKEKGDIIFAKAWDEGHSEGYCAVANKFEDLVDFVRRLGVFF